MKKKSIYFALFALAMAIGFTSCSKREDGPAKKIAKEYTDKTLTVTNAGEQISGGLVKIDAVNDNEAKITLTNIVNGHPAFEVLTKVIQTKSQTEYTVQGQKNVDGMSVNVKGTIVDGVATVDIEIQIVNPTLLKSWTYSSDEFDNMNTAIFELSNKSEKAPWQGGEIPVAEFNSYAQDWMNLFLGMALSNLSLTFDKSGYVGLTAFSAMAPEGQQEINIPKLARFYYNPTTKVLLFDAPLGALSPGLGTVQVPFDCTIENGVLTAIIKPEFLVELIPMIPTGETLAQLLIGLDSVFPADFVAFLPAVKALITDIATAITHPDVTGLKLGAKLTAGVPAPSPQTAALKEKLIK